MNTLTQTFLKGLLVIIPLLLTFMFLYWLFETAEQMFRIPLQLILPQGWYMNGMGVISALLFTLFIGFLVKIYVIKLLLKAFENLLNKLPLVKQVYGSIHDLIHFLSGSGKNDMQQVVALDINGIKLIGFVTGEGGITNGALDKEDPKVTNTGTKEKVLSVYLPMSYQIGGYLVYVPESQCEVLDMPVNQAMQTVLTANINRGEG